jgi:hypothetical protein
MHTLRTWFRIICTPIFEVERIQVYLTLQCTPFRLGCGCRVASQMREQGVTSNRPKYLSQFSLPSTSRARGFSLSGSMTGLGACGAPRLFGLWENVRDKCCWRIHEARTPASEVTSSYKDFKEQPTRVFVRAEEISVAAVTLVLEPRVVNKPRVAVHDPWQTNVQNSR